MNAGRAGSTALVGWSSTAQKRLDQLLTMHRKATGSSPGRRWETTEFNRALMVALVGQFQAFCRDLHDCAVLVHRTAAVAGQQQLLQIRLTEGRKLDVGNPRRSALGSDFGRLGFNFIEALKSHDAQSVQDLGDLDRLVDYRNAVSHANETLISGIESEGRIRATKQHFSRNRRTLHRLAHTMDHVVASELSTLLNIATPW